MTISSAGASLNEPPPNYNNWPSVFWRPFFVVTLLSNNCHTVSVVVYSCSFHLHGPLRQGIRTFTANEAL